jgi:CheY-like chemotaxis protein
LHADPIRLAQVLSNLLNNAARYTPVGGTVCLAVENDNNQVLFRVRDNGIGIPADMLVAIFEPFTQVARSLDRSEGGLGIGLTLVRRLVQMHAGSVQAHSAGPNQGSEFIVRLPTAPAGSIPGKPEKPQTPLPHRRRRVLVVDDNQDVAESTAMVLRLIGSEVFVANDGPAALAAALSFQPEIVLLDIGLPGMDGFEVARRLRGQVGVQQPLLVALSGYAQEEDRKRSSQAGFDLHLVKPANLPDLKALIADAKVHHKSRAYLEG